MKTNFNIKLFCYLLAGVLTLTFLFPLYWMLITSFKSYREAFSQPPTFFPLLSFSNFRDYFSQVTFMIYIKNSLVVTLISTVFSMVIGVFAAYALARGQLKGGNQMALFMLASRFVPAVATIIPTYMIFRRIGLYDNTTGLILLHMAMNIPYVVWMMRSFFREIPLSIEEASWIEGCGRIRTIFYIVLPMSRMGLAATAVLTMVFSWNEFLYAMIMTGAKAKTLPLSMSMYMAETGIEWNMMATAGVIILLPALVFSILVHRNLGSGLSAGAVKG